MPNAMRVTLGLLFKQLRLSAPWSFKVPFLISILYFYLYTGVLSLPTALLAVCCSLCTIIGIAGFGYFCNDVTDREADRKAGRPNGTLALTKMQIALLFAFFVVVALVPWVLYFPVNWVSLGLLAGQFLLFIAYATPPLRLKERGVLGLVADALYAHAIPAILAGYTFHLLTNQIYKHTFLLLGALGSWQFFLGLRNILQHQILDVEHDRGAGSCTYAVQAGPKAAFNLMKGLFVPLEILGFVTFTVVISLTIPVMVIAWPVYLLIAGLIVRLHWKEKLLHPLNDRLHFFMDDYYLRWIPLILLGALCLRGPRMGTLLLLHLLLFKNGLTPFFRAVLRSCRQVLARLVPPRGDIDVNNPVRKSMATHTSPRPSAPVVPADPGKLYIWREPYEPIVRIEPHNTPSASIKRADATTSTSIGSHKEKAFFLGVNRLGDFLCTTPVIRGFRKLNPETFITYIVQNAPYCRALDGNPDIDLVIYNEDLYLYGEKVLSEEWLRRLPIDIEEPSYLYRFNIHEVCRFDPHVFEDHVSRGFASYLQIPIDSVRPVIALSREECAVARAFVRKPYIVFAMQAGTAVVGSGGDLVLKDWIFERWLHLAKNIPSLGDFEIVAIGSEKDVQVQSRYFRSLYGLPIKIVAALLKEAACVVTVEGGVSHLCHAVDAPMVVIFSKYVPFSWAFPREASCCCVIYKDPRLISSQEVLSAVKSVLSQKGRLP